MLLYASCPFVCPSLCLSICFVWARNSKTEKNIENKIGVNIPQLKRLKLKVTRGPEPHEIATYWHTCLLTGGGLGAGDSGADCKLGLTIAMQPSYMQHYASCPSIWLSKTQKKYKNSCYRRSPGHEKVECQFLDKMVEGEGQWTSKTTENWRHVYLRAMYRAQAYPAPTANYTSHC